MSAAGQFLLFVRYGLRAELGRFRRLRRGQQAGLLVLAAGFAGILLLVAAGVAGVASAAGPATATAILTGSYIAAGLVLILASLPLGLGLVSETSEVPLLLTTPARLGALFSQKLLVAAFWEGAISVLLLLPVTIGVGTAAAAGPGYYLLAVLLLVMTPLFPLSLGQIIVFGLIRVVSPRAVRTVLGLVGAVLGAGWYFLRFSESGGAGSQLGSAFSGIGQHFGWLPFGWPGRALTAAAAGSSSSVALWALLTVVLSLASFAGAVMLAVSIARNGWLEAARPANRRRIRRAGAGEPRSFGNGAVPAILLKDWRAIIRDPLVWTRLLGPLAAFGVVVYWLLSQAAGLSGPAALPAKAAAVAAAISFLAWSLNNRLALSAFNRERRAIVWLLASPIPVQRLVRAKLLVALIPQFVILVPAALLLTLAEGLPIGLGLVVVIASPMLVTAMCAITLLTATYFPKFDWRDVQRVNTGPAILLSSAMQALVAAVFLLVLAGGAMMGAESPLILALLAVLAVVALVPLLLLFGQGVQRVNRWEIAA